MPGSVEPWLVNRAGPSAVALETTLLVHGVPRASAMGLADDLGRIVTAAGATPALVGVVNGRATVGMTRDELTAMLSAADTPSGVPKANTANLGALMHRGGHAATTVSATMELAEAAGIRVFATGGIGGVHKVYATHWDVSADLAALARTPMVVVASGVKSLLDVRATREVLETLGVCVVGFRTDNFPAFYLRSLNPTTGGGAESQPPISLDARFDDEADLADFARRELARRRSAILVCNPIPAEHEIDPAQFNAWLTQAERECRHAHGRDVTPALLARLHAISAGVTLRANIELVKSNAALAGRLAARISRINSKR